MKQAHQQQLTDWQQGMLKGNEEAFNSLFRYYYTRLVHFSINFVHLKSAAEEIVSDVFVKIWERRSLLDSIDNLEVYLFVAVRNQSLNYREKYSHLHLQVELNGSTQLFNMHDPARELEWKELQHRLDIAVETLPEQCKVVFKLVKEDALKQKEVARILGISPRTVETQLYRAVRRIKEILIRVLPIDKENSGNS